MIKYLTSNEIIDWEETSIIELAKNFYSKSKEIIAKKCFEWVRDQIKHSYDFKLNPVTYKASDVLKFKTGYCFAKSHLLVALLRANGIPSGLCYQRLIKDNTNGQYCLHGLTAIYLEKYGWYRVDPGGNKKGIDAQFNPPEEMLAFKICNNYEADLQEIWANPLHEVIDVLKNSKTYIDVYNNLPDVELIKNI